MFFWNIDELKMSLVKEPLPESEGIKYFLIYVFFGALLYALPHSISNSWEALMNFGSIPILLIGTYYCYKKNGGSNGSYFLQRYFSIGWVVSIRTIIIYFFPLFVILIIFEALTQHSSNGLCWHMALFALAFTTFLYWRIAYHIGQVSDFIKNPFPENN